MEIPLLRAAAGSSDGAVSTSPGRYDKAEDVIPCDEEQLPELSFITTN